MIKHPRMGAIISVLMAAAVLLTSLACLHPQALASLSASAAPGYVSAMDKTKVLSIQIVADEADWAGMLENAAAEEYIPATIIIDGVKLENVGIRPKGNSSLSMVARDDTTDRYSFKIEFDHYITGQNWLGLDKLVVNNMQGDATYMKEYLSYDLMDYIGVDAPRYAFADIAVNGSGWGLYLAVEALEDSYVQRLYGKDHGALYKPESTGMGAQERGDALPQGGWAGGGEMAPPSDIPAAEGGQGGQLPSQDGQEARPNRPGGQGFAGGMAGMGGMASNGVSLQYTDDDPSSYSAIFDNAVFKTGSGDEARLIGALKGLSTGENLEDVVDVEATLRYFAAHTVVVNLDSYVSNMGHNYYLYEENGRLTILPWDYNLAFGGFQSGNASSVVNFPIDTPVSGVSLEDRPLLGKLLAVPEYLELYHGYLAELTQGYFNSGLFEETVDALDALISPYVEQDATAFYDYAAYRASLPQLKTLGLLRAESIQGQLSGTIPSTSEGQSTAPDALVDASSLDLSALGSQGGGMGGDREAGDWTGRRPDGFDPSAQAGAENGQMGGFAPPGRDGAAQSQTAVYSAAAWAVPALCFALLLAALWLVSRFRRRRSP